MRILVVSQYYYPEPVRIHEICEELCRRGHNITVVTSVPNYPEGKIYEGYKNSTSHEVMDGIKVIRCKIRPRKAGNINLAINYLSFIISAKRVIDSLKGEYDLIYGYQLSPITSMIPIRKFKKKYGTPFLLYCLDLWPASIEWLFSTKTIVFKLVKSISMATYKMADLIAVTSPSFIGYLEAENKIDKDKMRYIPQHASDLLAAIKSYAVENMNKNRNIINFLFAGNIGKSQNLEKVLVAIKKCKHKSRILFHIVGSGSDIQHVKDTCEKLQLFNNVIFYGRQPKERMPEFYHIADVCIVSLRQEGFVGFTIPGKLQECMSAGKAILGFIDGDANYIIDDAKCGLCIPADDTNMLATAIDSFVEKEDKLPMYGLNARSYFCNHFTIDKHVDQLEKAFSCMSSDLNNSINNSKNERRIT